MLPQSRPILLSSSNLRLDNRRPLEIRPHEFTFGSIDGEDIDGSATAEQGLTKVVAVVSGPKANNTSTATTSSRDKVTLNVEVDWTHFSGNERRPRGKADRRLVELSASIKSTFEPVIMNHLYGRSLIEIRIIVLGQDGGILSAAINATSLALVHAGVAIACPVAALSISSLHDTPFLDPNTVEESDLPTLTVACLNRDGKATLVSMETRLAIERFEGMLRLGMKAVRTVGEEMDACCRRWAEETAARRERRIA